jgi:hypothetical protein
MQSFKFPGTRDWWPDKTLPLKAGVPGLSLGQDGRNIFLGSK